MKNILLITLLIQLNISFSQDETDNQTDKPSWSEELPEMIDAPNLDLDSSLDTEINFDMEDLGMDRDSLFNDTQEEVVVKPEIVNENAESENKAESERLTAEKAQAEKLAAEKVASEKAKAEKSAAEKAASEKAKAEKLAAEKAASDKAKAEQLAIEKAISDKAKAEKIATDKVKLDKANAAVESKSNVIKKESGTKSQNAITYDWKKIKDALPIYPSRAARSGDEGWVEVQIEIDIYGNVINSEVIDSYKKTKTFNRSALNAVKKWKFEPPVNYGLEDNQVKIVRMIFKL